MKRLWFCGLLAITVGCSSDPQSPPGDPGPGDGGPGDSNPGDPSSGDSGPSPYSALSDEFSMTGVDLLGAHGTDWQILHPERAVAIDIGGSTAGRLTIVAQNGPQFAWFEDEYGSLVYKNVTGNFAAAIRLRVVDNTSPTTPPTGTYNAGGFVIRDGVGTHSGDENWVMYNVGMQDGAYAREIKKTVDSVSRLYLNDAPFEEHMLLACRIGSTLHFYHWTASESGWGHEQFFPMSTRFNHSGGSHPPELDTGQQSDMFFVLDGLPATVQVGVMAGSWTSSDATLVRAEVDWFRFGSSTPMAESDCLADFAAP